MTADKQLLRAMYEDNKLKLSSGYALRFIGFHYAHIGKRGRQVLLLLTIPLGVGIVRWLLQGLEVRSNINRYNKKLAKRYGVDER